MSQFDLTGEKIAQEIALEGYGDPEKAKMRAALEELTTANQRKDAALKAILQIGAAEFSNALGFNRTAALYIALARIEELVAKALAP